MCEKNKNCLKMITLYFNIGEPVVSDRRRRDRLHFISQKKKRKQAKRKYIKKAIFEFSSLSNPL